MRTSWKNCIRENRCSLKSCSRDMLEAVGEVYSGAKYQRCVVPFYRDVFSVVPRSQVKLAAKILKAIHAQESKAKR